MTHTLRAEGFDASEDGTGRGTPLIAHTLNAKKPSETRGDGNDNLVATTLRMREGKPGGGKGPLLSEGSSLTLAQANDQTVFQPAVIRTGGDYGDPTVSVDDKAFLAANPMSDRQMAIHSNEMLVRRLTPTECERLQGFPDGWTEDQPDSTRYRQLGNAVAVPCVEWIARRLMAVAADPQEGES